MGRIALIATYDNAFLGIRYMSACLKQAGHDCVMITFKNQYDFINPGATPGLPDPVLGGPTGVTEHELDLLVDLLREKKVDYVGLSVISHYIQVSQLITQHLRKVAPDIPLIWGGIDVTMHPNQAIGYADICVLGEAERTIVELVEALDQKKSLEGLRGVWFRNDKGEVIKNPLAPTIDDLNALPFPDWDFSNYFAITSNRLIRSQLTPDGFITPWRRIVLTSRGCPFTCSYCFHGSESVKHNEGFDERVRRRSVENVIAEMKWLRDTTPGLQHYAFNDEVFTLMPPWIEEFSNRYAQELKGLEFSYYTYPKTTKKPFLDSLKKAGLQDVVIGIQSGSDRLNKEDYARPTTKKDAISACNLINSYGLEYHIDMLGDSPFETEADYRESVDLLLKLPRPYNVIGVYKLHFYRNYGHTNHAFDKGIELVQVNENTWLAPYKPEYTFWEALYYIAALGYFTPEGMAPFMDCAYLREHAEALTELSEALKHHQYIFTESCEKKRKDRYLSELERDLAKVLGSRPVAAWISFKNRFSGNGGWIHTKEYRKSTQRVFGGASSAAGGQHTSDVEANLTLIKNLSAVSDACIAHLRNSPALQKNPVGLMQLADSFHKHAYVEVGDHIMVKNDYMRMLEDDLGRLRGSRPVKWWIQYKNRREGNWLVLQPEKVDWASNMPDLRLSPTRLYAHTNRP